MLDCSRTARSYMHCVLSSLFKAQNTFISSDRAYGTEITLTQLQQYIFFFFYKMNFAHPLCSRTSRASRALNVFQLFTVIQIDYKTYIGLMLIISRYVFSSKPYFSTLFPVNVRDYLNMNMIHFGTIFSSKYIFQSLSTKIQTDQTCNTQLSKPDLVFSLQFSLQFI